MSLKILPYGDKAWGPPPYPKPHVPGQPHTCPRCNGRGFTDGEGQGMVGCNLCEDRGQVMVGE